MISSVPPVVQEPAIRLARWQVIEVSDGQVSGRFLVGHDLGTGEGRMSTPIQQFDADTSTAITRSGRRYKLVGPPGYDPDGSYVWDNAMANYGIPADMQRNVSDDYACPAPNPVAVDDQPPTVTSCHGGPSGPVIAEGSVGVDVSALAAEQHPMLGDVFITPVVQFWLTEDPANAGELAHALDCHTRDRLSESTHGPLAITTNDTAAGIVTIIARADEASTDV